MATLIPRIKEWYEIDGVEFATHGYMISRIQRSAGAKKGDNVNSPANHGDQFREKRLTARAETWSLWVCDAKPSTGEISATELGRRSQFNSNLDEVLNALNRMPDLLEVIHHRIAPDDETEMEPRVGYAEIVSAISIGDYADLDYVEFDVEVVFPDPRWRSPQVIDTPLSATFGGTDEPVLCTAADVGTAPVDHMTIKFTSTGSLTNPELWNDTYDHTYTGIGYNGTIPTGESVIIDTNNMTLKKEGTNDISKLLRMGNRQAWFELFPQNNTLTFSALSGTGTVEIEYRKAYY